MTKLVRFTLAVILSAGALAASTTTADADDCYYCPTGNGTTSNYGATGYGMSCSELQDWAQSQVLDNLNNYCGGRGLCDLYFYGATCSNVSSPEGPLKEVHEWYVYKCWQTC